MRAAGTLAFTFGVVFVSWLFCPLVTRSAKQGVMLGLGFLLVHAAIGVVYHDQPLLLALVFTPAIQNIGELVATAATVIFRLLS